MSSKTDLLSNELPNDAALAPKRTSLEKSVKQYENLLSDLVFYRTYAKTFSDGRKETYDETVSRVSSMHVEKFPLYAEEIRNAFTFVNSMKVAPSMRSMQFAGEPIKRSPSRVFNCAYVAASSWEDIADIFFKLMNGCGVGYSVQSRHTSLLPVVPEGQRESFIIEDSKEGWSDSIIALGENPKIIFDYSKIRDQGTPLSTGGTASGPAPLRHAHEAIRKILLASVGKQLRPLDVHEIITLESDCVVVGGVRRSALLCLFDADDDSMLTCKSGSWWVDHPHFARANNSAVLHREDPEFQTKLKNIMDRCFKSGYGEPGIFLTNDYDMGANPCVEISLKSRQCCNLTEVNVARCADEDEFLRAVEAATIIGTLQATYTNFNYVNKEWQKNCEDDALLGVSLTGQAEKWDMLSKPGLLNRAAELAVSVNRTWAERLGINPAARIGCTKPSGTTSALFGTTSGIHAAHSEYYLRRVRVDVSDPIAQSLISVFGHNEANSDSVIEKDNEKPDRNVVVTIPIRKAGAITREKETALQLLERSKFIYDNWISTSHNYGANKHNVSLTVSYKESEKEDIVKWMLENSASYTGIAFLPYDDVKYQQAPFQEISESEYLKWLDKFSVVSSSEYVTSHSLFDFSALDYSNVEDTRQGEVACAGGVCEVK